MRQEEKQKKQQKHNDYKEEQEVITKVTNNNVIEKERHTSLNTKDIAMIAVCSAVMAICSWISIPAAIPFTLQTFGVFLTIGLLGGRNGNLSVLVYLLLGAVGLPVFAGFSGEERTFFLGSYAAEAGECTRRYWTRSESRRISIRGL